MEYDDDSLDAIPTDPSVLQQTDRLLEFQPEESDSRTESDDTDDTDGDDEQYTKKKAKSKTQHTKKGLCNDDT